MEPRFVTALLLVLLTTAGVVAALLYATREARAERRNLNRAESRRLARNKERIRSERREAEQN